MIAASLIFYAIALIFLGLAGAAAYLFATRGVPETTELAAGGLMALLISAGAFAAADMIWRAA